MNNIPQTIKDSIAAIIDGLTPLAQKMGIAVEHIFGWAIKHNFAIAGAEIFAWLVSIVFAWLVSKFYKTNQHAESEGIQVMVIFGIIGASILLFVSTMFLITDAIPRIIAPEWYSIKDIINLIKANKQ